MIEICPAILVDTEKELVRELEVYSPLFQQIDIDINIEGDSFEGMVTPDYEFIADSISDFKNTFGIHLMVSNPYHIIQHLFERLEHKNIIFYVHQETDFKPVLSAEFLKSTQIGITVNPSTSLFEIDFYNQFKEVQLMTVEPGYQGRGVEFEVFKRIDWLRSNGYDGKISIDGGVGLEIAGEIKKHDLNRVSVGSYFSKSNNVKQSLDNLREALSI